MAENLVCAKTAFTCFDDDEEDDDDLNLCIVNEIGWNHRNSKKDRNFDRYRSISMKVFPLLSDESIGEMVEREKEYFPIDDYLKRLRCGDLELSVRNEAIDWILKACVHYQFGPLCICLSINYLDRFLSAYQLPKDKVWTVQLLAVACLSLAAKMEESEVPQSIDLQVGEPKFVFEAKTIQKMELLVLSTLRWRMLVLTPCSFIDYFVSKVSDDSQYSSETLIARSLQLILSTNRGIDFLDFSPSEIAAAAAISVSAEIKKTDFENLIAGFKHVNPERVVKCVEMMKDLTMRKGSAPLSSTSSSSNVVESPNGVLEVTCLSYKSDDTTVGSCVKSSHTCPDNNKRRKQ